jgi:hypothetical protein
MRKYIYLITILLLSDNALSIETLDGFLISAFDNHFKVVSPERYKPNMEVIVENKTLVRLIGKVVLNNKKNIGYFSIEPDKYQKIVVALKKDDILHFYPLSPAFQEVELIVGNKVYEIPPKK